MNTPNNYTNKLKQLRRKKSGHLDHWWILFLVWPFASFINALSHFSNPKAKTVVWWFFVFFGFVFIYSRDIYEGADSARYALQLTQLHHHWYSFEYSNIMFYSGDGYVDLYQPLVTWIVAFFTDNARWLFTVFAAVFGWFYVQNMWIIFDRITPSVKHDWFLVLMMLAFALTNPIWNINGVRMWTATQVFVYGALRYLLEHDKKGIAWIVSSILIHFSFFIPVFVFLAYLFIPKNITACLIVFYAASLISELDLSVVRSSLSFMPDFLQPRVTAYTNEGYALRLQEEKRELSTHVKLSPIISKWLLYGWIFIIYLTRKRWLSKYKNVQNLFILGLLLGSIAQVLSLVPSGGRYMNIVSMFFYAIFVLFVAEVRTKQNLTAWRAASFPLLLFLNIFNIRMGLDFVGLSLFITNPLIAPYWEDTTPIIEYFKQFIN